MSKAKAAPETREVREFIEALELRSAPEGSKSPGTMAGYAAVFNRYSEDLGLFREKLAPGCFRAALAKCDVRALFNHDPSKLLGRKSAGTLRMVEDDAGLRVEIDLPDTELGREVAYHVAKRNLVGQSFSFTTEAGGDDWDFSGAVPLRTVRSVAGLFDVGPVTFPAYSDTTTALRSFEAARALREAPPPIEPAPAPVEPAPPDFANEDARLRLLEVF